MSTADTSIRRKLDLWREEAAASEDPFRAVGAQAAYAARVQQEILVTLRDSMALAIDDMAALNALMKQINEALGKVGGKGPDEQMTVATGPQDVEALIRALVAADIDPALYRKEGTGSAVKLVMTKEAGTKINGNLDIEVQTLSTRHQKLSSTFQQGLQNYNTSFDLQTSTVKDGKEVGMGAISGIKAG